MAHAVHDESKDSESVPLAVEEVRLRTSEEEQQASRLKNEFLLASFGLLNVLIAELVLGLQILAPVQKELQQVWSVFLVILSVALLLYCGGSILEQALHDLKEKFISRNVCKALGLMLLAAYSVYALFTQFPNLEPTPVVNTLILVLFVLTLDKLAHAEFMRRLRSYVGVKIESVLEPSRKVLAKDVESIEESDSEVREDFARASDIPFNEIKVGDRVRLEVGDIAPCDSVVKEGTCEVNERKFTLRSEIRVKSPGQDIFAGSEITRGTVLVEVGSLPDESILSYFIAVLNRRVEAIVENTRAKARQVESASSVFLIFIAAASLIYWSDKDVSLSTAISISAAVLFVTLIPRFFKVSLLLKGLGVSSAFYRGLLIPSADILEKLANLKKLIIDYSEEAPPGQMRVVSFELVDERVDEASLSSALTTLYGAGEDEQSVVIASYFRENFPESRLYEIKNANFYSGKGLSASVEGVELSLGTEAFLLERGVQLQPSEVKNSEPGEETIYIAVGAELAARLIMTRPFLADGKELHDSLRRYGVRSVLMSENSAETADLVGKSAGIELASIFGGLSEEKYLKKLDTYSPTALLAGEGTRQEYLNKADLTLAVFNQVLWEVEGADVLSFNKDVRFVVDAWKLARTYVQVTKINMIFSILLSVLLLGLAVSGFLTPAVTALSVLLGSIFLYLNVLRLYPR